MTGKVVRCGEVNMTEERAIVPGPADDEGRRQRLSALMDGELGDADAARLCADWRDDAQLRVTWHAYHLIGDVMRSDDLAHAAAHDEAFLRSLRERLALEPVVLAPAATVAPASRISLSAIRRSRRWMTSTAVAAGFAAVAGVMVVMRTADPGAGSAGPVLASAPVTPAPAGVVKVGTDVAPGGAAGGSDDVLIRDARLDRYLEAHRQYGPGVVMVPGGVVRSTAVSAVQQR